MSTHADTPRPSFGFATPSRLDVLARRRVLALIATECPGQDVAGVVVIDDALRIDFVSGAALLVGADGTLSWESAGPREEHCANCGAGQGEPCAAALHDECNCWPEPRP